VTFCVEKQDGRAWLGYSQYRALVNKVMNVISKVLTFLIMKMAAF
jgi:hypothetical protein